MEFFHGVVALVAGIVLVLTGLVAWLYVQQSRMSQAINALAIAITAPPSFPSVSYESELHASEPVEETETEQVPEQTPAPAPTPTPAEEDDRVSVEDDDVEIIGEDMATLGGKTVVQLREMLTAKGIPYSKSDKKPTLISLLQAAS
jgi:hypothetical protein